MQIKIKGSSKNYQLGNGNKNFHIQMDRQGYAIVLGADGGELKVTRDGEEFIAEPNLNSNTCLTAGQQLKDDISND